MKMLNVVIIAMLVAGGAAYAAQTTSRSLPQEHPLRPIRWVVPYAPGGAADVMARIIAQKLSEQWDKSIVIDNRAGANGIIGADIVAKSAPNGLTWLSTNVGHYATNAGFFKDLPYDIGKDFTTVATLATTPFIVYGNVSLPARNLQEVVALARKNPGQLNYGAPPGAMNHLIGVILNSMAGVDIMFVPYRGAGAALTDTLAGRIQLSYATTAAGMPLVRAGKLRALAISSAKRSDALPDVPTIVESGFPNFDVNMWNGIIVPAGTPAATIKSINTDINKLLTTKHVIDRFSVAGAEPLITTPEDFAKMARDDIAKWPKVIKSLGVKIEKIE